MLSKEDREMSIRSAAFERGYAEGFAESFAEGFAKGFAKGEAEMRELGRLLLEAGRKDEFFAALSDERKMNELMEEFGIA